MKITREEVDRRGDPRKQLMWWGYLHSCGSIEVKRWLGDHRDYTEDCDGNDLVVQVVAPFVCPAGWTAREIIEAELSERQAALKESIAARSGQPAKKAKALGKTIRVIKYNGQYVQNYQYSQGVLSDVLVDDPLKAMDLMIPGGNPEFMWKLYKERGGVIETFVVTCRQEPNCDWEPPPYAKCHQS